jgi:hypothetical protein
MAAAWVGVGLVLIVGTIVVASLLPRPSPEYSIAQLIKIYSPDLWASRIGIGKEGAKSKPDNPSSSGAPQQEGQQADQQGGGKPDPNNKSGEPTGGDKGKGGGEGKGKESQSGQSKSDSSQSDSSQSKSSQQSQDQSKSQSDSSSSDSKSKPGDQSSQNSSQEKQSNQTSAEPKSDNSNQNSADKNQNQDQQGSSDQKDSQQQSSSSGSSSSSSPQPPQIMRHLQTAISAMGGILKAVFYLAIAIAAAILAWRYRADLLAAWKKLLAELAALWPNLFGKKDQATTTVDPTAPAPPRPFAQFTDPFTSGQAARMSPAEVVRYTFAALEAWGRENGCPRAIGQTPHEYAAAIGQLDQSVGREAGQLAELYARMAYAPPAAIRTSFEPLRALWRKMTSPAVEVVGA